MASPNFNGDFWLQDSQESLDVETMNDNFAAEILEYEQRLLHLHQLTILDYWNASSNDEVLEDQEYNKSTPMDPSVLEPQKSLHPVLRWNFPITGEIFIDILQSFINGNTETYLQQQCEEYQHWYKCLFFRIFERQSTFMLHITVCHIQIPKNYSSNMKAFKELTVLRQ